MIKQYFENTKVWTDNDFSVGLIKKVLEEGHYTKFYDANKKQWNIQLDTIKNVARGVEFKVECDGKVKTIDLYGNWLQGFEINYQLGLIMVTSLGNEVYEIKKY